jgi:hypothetical protein
MAKRTRVKKFRIDEQFDQIVTIDEAIHCFLENCSDNPNASVQLNLKNDTGRQMSFGLCSSNCNVPGTAGPNSGGIVLEAPADLQISPTYKTRIIFKNNPDDDGDFTKVQEIASVEEDGGLHSKGFSKLGESSPEFKIKYLSGTTPNNSVTQTYVTGIAKDKIISEPEIVVDALDGKLLPRNHNGVNDKYEASFDSNGDLEISVFAAALNVENRPFRGVFFYIE